MRAVLLLTALLALSAVRADEGACSVAESATLLLEWDWEDTEAFTLRPNEAALESLRAIEGEIAVVSVAGKTRTGKSTLLNALVSELLHEPAPPRQRFATGDSSKPVTEEVDFVVLPPCVTGKPLTVLLMDSPGVDAYNRHKVFDSQLLMLLSVLSSVTLNNIFGLLDRPAVESLYESIDAAQQLKLYSAVDPDAIGRPQLLFVMQQLKVKTVDPDTGAEIDSALWVQKVMERMDSVTAQVGYATTLNGFFDSIDAMSIRNPSETGYGEDIAELQQRVFSGLQPKALGGRNMDGVSLASMLSEWVKLANVPKDAPRGSESLVERMWHSQLTSVMQQYDADAEPRFAALELPVAAAEITAVHESLVAVAAAQLERFGKAAVAAEQLQDRLDAALKRNTAAAEALYDAAVGDCRTRFVEFVTSLPEPVLVVDWAAFTDECLAAVTPAARDALPAQTAERFEAGLRTELEAQAATAVEASRKRQQELAESRLRALMGELTAEGSVCAQCLAAVPLTSVALEEQLTACIAPVAEAVQAELEQFEGVALTAEELMRPALAMADSVRRQGAEALAAAAATAVTATQLSLANFVESCDFSSAEAAVEPRTIVECGERATQQLAAVEPRVPEVEAALAEVQRRTEASLATNAQTLDEVCLQQVTVYAQQLLQFHSMAQSWFSRSAYQPIDESQIRCAHADAAPHVVAVLRPLEPQLNAFVARKLAAMQILLVVAYAVAAVKCLSLVVGALRLSPAVSVLGLLCGVFVTWWAPAMVPPSGAGKGMHYAALVVLLAAAMSSMASSSSSSSSSSSAGEGPKGERSV